MGPPDKKKRKHDNSNNDHADPNTDTRQTQAASASPPLRVFGRQARRIRSHAVDAAASTMGAFFPDLNKIDPNPPAVPPRPINQMSSMTAEPPAEKVAMMLSLGLDQETAVRYLKAKRNDLDAAVNAFYDGEDISKDDLASKWDEGAFSSDREGNQALHPLGATAPPSRAPSRTGDRGGLQPLSREQEDADFAQAMAMSQSQTFEPLTFQSEQEGGVISGDGKQTLTTFGPATKSHYESKQWAMVPSVATYGGEIVPDVGLDEQHHVHGEPRVLKQVPEGDYMPNLLSILHSIPAAREALLMRNHVLPNYGENEDWWRGQSISLPTVVHLDGTPVQDEDEKEELIAEVQRLTAFLDASDRSVATPEALTKTKAIDNVNPNSTQSQTLAELVLTKWITAATDLCGGDDLANSLFTTKVAAAEEDGTLHHSDVNIIDIPTNTPEDEKADLSVILDNLFWGKDIAEMAETDNYLEQPSEVLILHLHRGKGNGEPLRVEIPAEMYVDKYLLGNAEAMAKPRQLRAQGLTRLQKIDMVEKRLTKWKHPHKNEQIDALELLSGTLGSYSGQKASERGEDAQMANGTADDDMNADDAPQTAEVARELERIIASINDKLTVLAKEKEKTRQALAAASSTPSGQPQGSLKHRYTLRGVATKHNITYTLQPKETTADDAGGHDAEMPNPPADTSDGARLSPDDDGTPPGMQWWRIEYEVHASGAGTAHISRTKAADYDVLRAAELEHGSALLVYASDAACTPSTDTDTALLPRPLRTFIDRDNALFHASLAASPPPAYASTGTDAAAEAAASRTRATLPFDRVDTQDLPPRESIEYDSFDSARGEGGASLYDFAGHTDNRGYDEAAEYGYEGGTGTANSSGRATPGSSPRVPAYGEDAFMAHGGFGLGPDLQGGGGGGGKWEGEDGDDDDDVKEIRLEDSDMEMVEMAHKPLLPTQAGTRGEQDKTGQDQGVGGAMHVEDTGGKI